MADAVSFEEDSDVGELRWAGGSAELDIVVAGGIYAVLIGFSSGAVNGSVDSGGALEDGHTLSG